MAEPVTLLASSGNFSVPDINHDLLDTEQDTGTTLNVAVPRAGKNPPKPTNQKKPQAPLVTVTLTRNPCTQPQWEPTALSYTTRILLKLFCFFGAADSAVQLREDLFHIMPGPGQGYLTLVTCSFSPMLPPHRAPRCMGEVGELHRLISAGKADKTIFSSFQRALFFQLFSLPANFLCSHCIHACLQEAANGFLFSQSLSFSSLSATLALIILLRSAS